MIDERADRFVSGILHELEKISILGHIWFGDGMFMNKEKRRENERKFTDWEPLPGGGRRYFYDVLSRRGGWKARHVKEVDAQEETVLFVQEIYNAEGRLVERHQKFPEDTGHQPIEGER